MDNLVKQKGFDDSRGSTEELYSSVYMNYSNYVHAKYPEVMDLYGGKPEHFHLDGMLGTPKDEENIGAIDTYINGTGITLQLIISKLRLHYLLEADTALRIWFHST